MTGTCARKADRIAKRVRQEAGELSAGSTEGAPRGARSCSNNMLVSASADKPQTGLVNSLGSTGLPI
jgi:hypothetical protein